MLSAVDAASAINSRPIVSGELRDIAVATKNYWISVWITSD